LKEQNTEKSEKKSQEKYKKKGWSILTVRKFLLVEEDLDAIRW
tara:strand:+ start:2054 stop:2182 length:129 start_codon:yes stop_codon:yes gene_type:complete